MILVLAGTADASQVIGVLKSEGYRVAASVVTEYGARLARQAGADLVRTGPLGQEELANYLKRHGIVAVIDATHPFAVNITENAREACRALGLPYFRYRRPEVRLPSYPNLLPASSFEEAAVLAARGQVIFLTIGTRHLECFTDAPALKGKRLVVRVLPEEDSLARCRRLGIWPRDIVAIQGPLSYELNRALYRQYQADVVVTKESGSTGGVEEKVRAALDLGLTVVVVRRPSESGGLPLEEIIPMLGEALGR
ncbi:precorrin-6A reductase [Thermanaeromonas sp. C210]|uniref:precorrin-6A reductase n=1 Tax=Thermanaeromonas sp. C210 TaxID=2731925 RepID=UPI00155C3623|nr:precorrin-6A reductase [Thermanaeromonas sp. C210]GFN23775.1 precorrin-6A reductase [Thermanaeromonas sp. C210]